MAPGKLHKTPGGIILGSDKRQKERQMASGKYDFSLAIGGEAGQGIATPGDILARIFVRRGPPPIYLQRLPVHHSRRAYLSDRPGFRPGAIQPRRPAGPAAVPEPGHDDPPPQPAGARAAGLSITATALPPGATNDGVHLCPLPVSDLSSGSRNRLIQNTIAVGAIMSLLGLDFDILEESLTLRFQRQGQGVIDENVGVGPGRFQLRQR